jgi:hypothetical protein
MQDAEKARQRRSRFVQTLNVPQGYGLGPSLAAALLTAFLSILPTDPWPLRMVPARQYTKPTY